MNIQLTLTKEQAEWLKAQVGECFEHWDNQGKMFLIDETCPGCQIATLLEQAGAQRSEK